MFIIYKNAKIHFTDTGKGKPVVLLHGFLENSKMWNYLIPNFSKSNRIIAIDLLGHGQTESIGYIHTMEEMANAVQEVLKSIQIDEAIFVGHSMGGYVSLAFVEQFSHKVKGLVLLNSTSFADSEERKINRDRAIVAIKQNYETTIRLSIANLFSETNRELLIEEIEEVRNEALQTPVQGIIAAQEGMKIRKDRKFILDSIFCAKLLILGKNDPVLAIEEHKNQVAVSELKILSGGHMSHIENKSEVITILKQFFELVS